MRLDDHLAQSAANARPLTPLDFLDRAETGFAGRTAVIWRDVVLDWAGFGRIVRRLAAWLDAQGVGPGDVVSMMCANRPEMLAAHYAVPALGAVLNSVNTRLDAAAVGWILCHAESRLLLCDPSSRAVAEAAGETAKVPVQVLSEDARSDDGLALLSDLPAFEKDLCAGVAEEWQAIALNYTSGTTGDPKGVVLTHRGACLNALGNALSLGFSPATTYLWVLPMFHCNGWCHTWAVTAAGGVHVCLDRVEPAAIFDALARHGVTHMACAPVVLYMLLNDPSRETRSARARVQVATGGAAPTAALIENMDSLGFDFVHLYGLTESYGPTSQCILTRDEAMLPLQDRAHLLARQGIRHVTANRVRVVDDAGVDVPRDGMTPGEIVLQGNTLMAGYLGDAAGTGRAMAGGHFHTGDIAVMHPDGDVEIRDRLKDVIITGGENVSSLEVEGVLHRHPDVLLAAVVARPDEKWGEVPMAFLELRRGASPDTEALDAFCRQYLSGFKVPRAWDFRELPKTATGKIQKYLLRQDARGPMS